MIYNKLYHSVCTIEDIYIQIDIFNSDHIYTVYTYCCFINSVCRGQWASLQEQLTNKLFSDFL